MRVVLDANVLIAAFATRGLCADVLEYCLYEHTIILSKTLLREIQRALCFKIKLPKAKAIEIVNFLSAQGEMFRPQKLPQNACKDKKDLHILGLALAAKADAIVTGDADLLILKKFHSIPILSPREFWTFVVKRKTA